MVWTCSNLGAVHSGTIQARVGSDRGTSCCYRLCTCSLSLMCIPLSCGNALPHNIFAIYLSVQSTNVQHDGELHAEESIFGVGEKGGGNKL
jgi:hypothetical protein